MNRLNDLWSDQGTDIERLVFFSDAVFAIALTLLVLDLRVPETENSTLLPDLLLALWPKLLSFLISFFVLSLFWRSHQRLFHLIEGYDRFIVGLNFVFLLGIVLQPFTTSLVSSYGEQRIAMLLDAALLALMGLVLTLIWVYATSNRRLVSAELDASLIRFYTLRMLVPALIFLASVPLVLVVDAAWVPRIPFLWLLIFPVRRILRSLLHRPRPTTAKSVPARVQDSSMTSVSHHSSVSAPPRRTKRR